MAGFVLQRVLQVLDRLYDFPGGTRGLNEFDLASAIQPVHNVGRMAELGARGADNSGFLYIGQALVNVSSAPETALASTDIYGAFDSIGEFSNFRTQDHRLWLYELFAGVDDVTPGNWTDGATAIQFDPDGTDRQVILQHWDFDIGPITAGGARPAVGGFIPMEVIPVRAYPIFFPLGSRLVTRSLSQNNVTFRTHTIWWAGPIGVTPPGMQ